MATSVAPALIAALYAQASAALPTTLVLLGPGITDDPGDYLMVGCNDPDAEDDFEIARVDSEQMTFGSTRPRMEDGAIHMVARSRNGDSDLQAAIDAAYAIQEALAAVVSATDNLGVAGVMKLGNATTSGPWGRLDGYGALATLHYDITFSSAIHPANQP